MTKLWAQEVRKAKEKAKKDAEAAEAQRKRAEEAKKVVIKEDANLPTATRAKLSKLKPLRDQRVEVEGWVHRLRRQGKALMFITLRDGTEMLQVRKRPWMRWGRGEHVLDEAVTHHVLQWMQKSV